MIDRDRKEFHPGLLHRTKRKATEMGIDPKDSRFGPFVPLDGTSLKPKRLCLKTFLRLKSQFRKVP